MQIEEINNKINTDDGYKKEERFTLKVAILTILKEWKILISIILVVSFATAIANFFLIKPSYQCKTLITINVPTILLTSAGEYTFVSTNPEEYLKCIYDEPLLTKTFSDLKIKKPDIEIKDFISYTITGVNRKTTDGVVSVEIIITSKDIRDLDKVANAFTSNFTKYVQAIAKRNAINEILGQSLAMKDAYKLDIEAKTYKAAQAAEILAKIPVLITVRQALLSNPDAISKLLKEKNPDISELTGDILLSEIINPAYEEMQLQIAAINTELVEVKSLNERNDKMIPELEKELEAIEKYIRTGDSSGVNNDRYNVLGKRVEVAAIAVLPESPIAPNKARNILIAVFLSAIAGVFVALFKNYWQKY